MKTNIVLIGLMGCGKSTIGRKLSRHLNMAFIDVDDDIEQHYGSIKNIFEKGEEYFRDLESQRVESLSKRENTVIATGGGVVLRPSNIDALKKNGQIFYLKRPLDEILKTLDPSNRPLLSKGTEVLYALNKEREPLYLRYSDYVIDASDIENAISSISTICTKVL